MDDGTNSLKEISEFLNSIGCHASAHTVGNAAFKMDRLRADLATWEKTARLIEEQARADLAHRRQLETALDFYADEKNWRLGGQCDPNASHFIGPRRAQQALRAMPNGSKAGD